MIILKAYKTQLHLNNEQRSFMFRCCGASRYVYNWGLAEWKRQYEAGEKPSAYGLKKQFNSIKDDLCPWIRQLPYVLIESSLLNLGVAYKNAFRRMKQGEGPGFPKFKKRGTNNSFQVSGVKITSDHVKITHLGWVRLSEGDYIPLDAEKYGCYATISERAGKWFISVLAYVSIPDYQPNTTETIGVDLGIKSLAVCSDGKVFDNPKGINKNEKKLARLQRELARRKKGSKNRQKTKDKIGKLHYKISNTRKNSLHQVSKYVTGIKRPTTVVLEDLNVAGMVKNHHLARSISDASFSEIRRQIEYKAEWYGTDVIIADRFFASSKTCSSCGEKKSTQKLSDRIYTCENCGIIIDRDLNAAINLAAYSEGQI